MRFFTCNAVTFKIAQLDFNFFLSELFDYKILYKIAEYRMVLVPFLVSVWLLILDSRL